MAFTPAPPSESTTRVSDVAVRPATTEADEFYIGYAGGMPPGIRRAVRRAVTIAVIVVVMVAAVVTINQHRLVDATFEFGQRRTFEGWLTWSPAPSLLVREGGGWTRYWLVAQGKFGAARAVTNPEEGWVRLEGTRILRESWQMIEIVPGSVQRTTGAGASPEPATEATRLFQERGEIVDSKCYLGVMNPGQRIVHRDCAIRCLSGGIPAMFAYRDADGASHLALLLRLDGRPVGPDWTRRAGSTLTVSGNLHVAGDIEVLVVNE